MNQKVDRDLLYPLRSNKDDHCNNAPSLRYTYDEEADHRELAIDRYRTMCGFDQAA